jgi:hypothetical protein
LFKESFINSEGEDQMQNNIQADIDTLKQINIDLGNAESEGERKQLGDFIAPALAFRRADRTTVDNRAAFLRKVKPGDPRDTNVESIEIYGDRAIVKCVVTVKYASGDKLFHNLRLFVRHERKWKLLGWANEPM